MDPYRRRDRGQPMHLGEPVLLGALAAACLYLGFARDVVLLQLCGIVLAFVASLAAYGWLTGGRMED